MEGPDVNELADGMMSDDAGYASACVEDLVDLLTSADEDDNDMQEELGSNDHVRTGLVKLLCTGMQDAPYWSCIALSHLVHRSTVNISLVGSTPNIYEGLCRCLGFAESTEIACGVISQLAFCNTYNSSKIVAYPPMLPLLVNIVATGGKNDSQAATCALSNCAANSKECAMQIAKVPGMMEALKVLCRPPSAWMDNAGTSANGPEHDLLAHADGEGDEDLDAEERAVISAIGCLDNLSHYHEARPLLHAAGVEDVLIDCINLRGRSQAPSVISAESAMILTRFLKPHRLEALSFSRNVLETIAHCARCALDRQHWSVAACIPLNRT